MRRPVIRHLRLLAAALVAVLSLAACTTDEGMASSSQPDATDEDALVDDGADDVHEEEAGNAEVGSSEETTEIELSAPDLRVALNNLLLEHVFFAGAAVNEALQGSDPAFEAAAEALDRNSQDLAGAVGLVYGAEAGDAFLGLWRSHIDMFVDYTVGVATDNDEQADEAVEDLTGYANVFAVFLNGANPELPVDTVEQLVIEHVLTTKDAVDALAAGDAQAGFTNLRKAMGHMHMLADPLAGGISGQFPERFPGETEGPAADLQRHVLTLKEAVDTIDSGEGNPFVELKEAGGHMSHIADPLAATIAEQQGL